MEKKKTPLESLREHFNFQHFRAGQLEVIHSILARKDTFTLFATGVGKSLCFQLPALHTEKLVIVVSPLLSLIGDQVKNINDRFHRDIAVSFAATDVSPDAVAKIESGESLLVYVTPEVFSCHGFLQKLLQIHTTIREILFLAVDEAHFISSQGFNFRTSFRDIANFRTVFPGIPIMALTATASPHIRDDVIRTLQLKSPAIFTTSYDKPNLRFKVHMVQKKIAFGLVAKKLSVKPLTGSCVLFTYTKRDATHIHSEITRHARTDDAKRAALYHGDIPYEKRCEIQKEFNSGAIRMVVATGSSFGTGIDKNDIRNVIIFTIPKNFEEFYQLAGRAGRDGLPSKISCYIGPGDVFMHKRKEKPLTKEHKLMQQKERKSLEKLSQFCRNTDKCRRGMILTYFGEHTPFFRCEMCDNCKRTSVH